MELVHKRSFQHLHMGTTVQNRKRKAGQEESIWNALNKWYFVIIIIILTNFVAEW